MQDNEKQVGETENAGSSSQEPEKLDVEHERQTLDKVKEYMGPPPKHFVEDDPPPEKSNKKAKKIAVLHEENDDAQTVRLDSSKPIVGSIIEPTTVVAEKEVVASNPLAMNDEEKEVNAEIADLAEQLPEEIKLVDPNEAAADAEKAETLKTDGAVSDIVKNEGEAAMEAEDEAAAASLLTNKEGSRLKNFFKTWWNNKLARNATFAGLALIFIGSLVFPPTRYAILNLVGVRVSASLNVLDDKTQLPLRNVVVEVAGKSAKTDADGRVSLTKLKLGSSELKIKKIAYAPVTAKVTLGWGSNPLNTYKLVATGARYNFNTVDFLGENVLAGVEASAGEATAFSNEEGLVELALEPTDSDEIEIAFSIEGYRTEKVTIKADEPDEKTTPPKVKLVPSVPNVFISKRTGKLDLYKIDVDGKNEKILIAGNGNETLENIQILPSSNGKTLAFVTTRDGKKNSDGFLLSSLYIVNMETGESKSIASSERIELSSWFDEGDKLIYFRAIAGVSAGNAKRHRVFAYSIATENEKELLASNYINDLITAQEKIYAAPTSIYGEAPGIGVMQLDASGGSKKLTDQPAYVLFRVDYETLAMNLQDGKWKSYKLGNDKATDLAGPPASLINRKYVDSPDGSKAVWVDQRDGKGTLLVYDIEAKKDKEIYKKAGLVYPVRWLDSTHLIYRLFTSSETADYIISTENNATQKISDVQNVTTYGYF